MTGIIQILTIGVDADNFSLFSNVDNYISAFETNVSRQDLINGFPSDNIPNGTTIIRAVSTTVLCDVSIDIPLPATTTTTSTTEAAVCGLWTVDLPPDTVIPQGAWNYTDCNGIVVTPPWALDESTPAGQLSFCALDTNPPPFSFLTTPSICDD
tara:strand:+ start:181 stop:642 length:462 start_codon:yes stop_codon:yes gene_type:complete